MAPSAVDHAQSCDRNVDKIFSQNEAVVKIGMTAILIGLPGKFFGRIVRIHFLRSTKKRGSHIKIDVHVALETNTAA